jgi:DNA-binding NarL/FixJ family response regulator
VQLLSLADDLEICGVAVTTGELRAQMARTRPDVLVLDLNLGREPVWPLCGELRSIVPTLRIVGISAAAPPIEARGLLDVFIEKSQLGQELLPALGAHHAGAPVRPAKTSLDLAAMRDAGRAEARTCCAALALALSAGDREQSQRLAHGLKNSVDLLQDSRGSDLCQRLCLEAEQKTLLPATITLHLIAERLVAAADGSV